MQRSQASAGNLRVIDTHSDVADDAGSVRLPSDTPAVLTQAEFCKLAGIKPRTAEAWRLKGLPPRFLKVGSSVRYLRTDVEAWLTTCLRRVTGNPSTRERS